MFSKLQDKPRCAREVFFGTQRQAGSCSENPTVAEFIKTTENFRVVYSIWVDDILGNCHGRKLDDTDLQLARKPLHKRKRAESHPEFSCLYTHGYIYYHV